MPSIKTFRVHPIFPAMPSIKTFRVHPIFPAMPSIKTFSVYPILHAMPFIKTFSVYSNIYLVYINLKTKFCNCPFNNKSTRHNGLGDSYVAHCGYTQLA